MNIFILRHATAEPRGKDVAEADRQLTAKGAKDLKRVLRHARAVGVAPELILTSPWTRALDTARMAQKELKDAELVETHSLLPDVPPMRVWKEIQAHRSLKGIMIVGHEPQLQHIVAFLLEAPLVLDLKKAGIMRIDVTQFDGPRRGILKWMLTPKLAVRGK
ncbi:MAG TPA: phosphohistidine phosphatase SixA [Bryobacteraceae bacterium]|nr:phosphohistidine phosphatase SixA [Bryobacteraceae bacterium]